MTANPGWLRRRSAEPGLDLGFLAYWVLTGAFVGVGVAVALYLLPKRLADVDKLFDDAVLYFRATEAWLNGGNPWDTRSPAGVPFSGLPTTLLLNLPLIPFGAPFARAFWAVAGLIGWLAVMRRLRLAPWWILFPPFIEGWVAGSPDPALAGLIVVGGGAVAALAKPYSIPAMMAEHRWRAIGLAGMVSVITIPLLPWGQFMGELGSVEASLSAHALNVSAWGTPPLMLAVGVSLVALGPRLGLLLAVPGLWPSAQVHYAIFSARAGIDSAFLALILAIPRAAPFGIVIYAVAVRAAPWVKQRTVGRRVGPRPAPAARCESADD